MPFDVWALHSQPAYWGKRSKEELRARTLLGAMECLRHGITTIQDMNSVVPQDEETLDIILAAYAEAGIRVVFSIAVRDIAALDIEPFLPEGIPPESRRSSAASRAMPPPTSPSSRRRSSGSIRCPRACTGRSARQARSAARRALLEGIAELSERHGLPVFTHVYETRAQLAKARSHYPRAWRIADALHGGRRPADGAHHARARRLSHERRDRRCWRKPVPASCIIRWPISS